MPRMALLSTAISGTDEGWFRINMFGGTDHWIILVPRPRHFGGGLWYFVTDLCREARD